jgi:hypothetical protein
LFGVLGEIVFSEWWTSFYKTPLYLYRQAQIDYGFSSKFNLIPYGLGGMLFLLVIQIFSKLFPNFEISLSGLKQNEFYYIFASSFLAGLALQFMIRAVIQFYHPRTFHFEKPTLSNVLLFYMPFLLGLFSAAWLFNSGLLVLAAIFSASAALVEYLYGKFLEIIYRKKFWDYLPLSFDRGHFSPLSLVAFSLMGFYFWAIYGLCKMLISYV